MAGTSKLAKLTFAVLAGLAVVAQAAIAKPQPGDLDRSFGHNGVVNTRVDGIKAYAASVAIDRRHRIVAAGSNSSSGFLLARYKPNGELDPSFSGDGMRSVPFRVDDPVSVAIGKGGAITVAGSGCSGVGECGFSLARLTANGKLDQGFGNGGKVTIHFGRVQEGGTPLAVDSRGRAVVAGTSCRGPRGKVHCDFAVIRLKQDGELDQTFGKGDGRVATNIAPHDRKAFVGLNAMAIDSRGRIIAAGGRTRPDRVVLVRYKKDGRKDYSFGHRGIVEKTLDRLGGIQAIAITPKDKIVVAGPWKPDGRRKWALARFNRSGGLNRSFGNGGQTAVHIPATGNDEVEAVALDSRNRIIVTGKPDYSVARFQPNGKLNRSFGHRGTVTKDFAQGFPGAVAIDSRDRPVIAAGYPDFVLVRFIG